MARSVWKEGVAEYCKGGEWGGWVRMIDTPCHSWWMEGREGLSSTSLFSYQVIYSPLCCMLMGWCWISFSSFLSLSLICPQQKLLIQEQHMNTKDEISNKTAWLLCTSYLIIFITFTLRTFPSISPSSAAVLVSSSLTVCQTRQAGVSMEFWEVIN